MRIFKIVYKDEEERQPLIDERFFSKYEPCWQYLRHTYDFADEWNDTLQWVRVDTEEENEDGTFTTINSKLYTRRDYEDQ